MKYAIECKHIEKIYINSNNRIKALSNINLKIEYGEFIALMGPSGSGKTTLLNIIAGIDSPTKGKVITLGKNLTQLTPTEKSDFRAKNIGFIFQSYNLIRSLTAVENVLFPLALQNIPVKQQIEIAKEALRQTGIIQLQDRYPHQLSGGQKQRVAIARAIATKPKLILADEPTSNIDSTTAKKIIGLIARLNKENKITFICSTHDALLKEYTKKIIHVKDGKIN